MAPSPTLVAPAHLWRPESTGSAGGEAADLAASVGWVPDAEQRLALDVMLAENGPRWAAFEVAVIEARQNGKTFAAEAACLHDLFLRRVGRIVWTAHRYKTTSDSFADLAAVCENFDHLRRRVYRVQLAAGEQSIQLLPRHSGPRVDFLARTSGGGRGLDADVVVLDEALYLQQMMMGALLPTLSAKDDPQVRYLSSAGIATSEVLRRLRDRGRAGGDPSLAYVEWAAPDGGCAVEDCDHGIEATGCALDDPAAWQAANPAMGRRISVDYIAAERRALPPAEFARERLGWWDDPAGAVAVDLSLESWRALANPAAAPSGDLVLGVDVSPGHSSASLYVFGVGPVPVGELIVRAPGSSWLVDRVASIVAEHPVQSVAVDPAGPVGSLIPALQAAGVPLVPLDGKESVRAYAAFCAAARDGAFRHRGEPDMDAAVLGARPRAVGDGSKWSRRGSDVDISPLVAATCAYWVASTRLPGEPNIYFL